MKYYEVNFTLSPLTTDGCDLLAALAGEAGFETFEETAEGLCGYVQQPLFDRSQLDLLLQSFHLPGTTISYTVGEAEDRDWNEQWEQEGFEPIVVSGDGSRTIIIHDGRHLPDVSAAAPEAALLTTIEIDAKLAFGTGTHETTRMVCQTMTALRLEGRRVLDCGTGTGILSICALKLGAAEAVGYDIDEWAVDNARHNAVINGVDRRFTSLQGDATVLNGVEGSFQLVVANINRNILLADMPLMCSKMAAGGQLILSGFYTDDVPLLVAKAAELGLALAGQKQENGWACLLLQRAE